jgi:transposase
VAVGGSTVYRIKRRFVDNLERAPSEEPRPGAERKLTAKKEALLVATACAKASGGSSPLDVGAAGRRDGQAHRT